MRFALRTSSTLAVALVVLSMVGCSSTGQAPESAPAGMAPAAEATARDQQGQRATGQQDLGQRSGVGEAKSRYSEEPSGERARPTRLFEQNSLLEGLDEAIEAGTRGEKLAEVLESRWRASGRETSHKILLSTEADLDADGELEWLAAIEQRREKKDGEKIEVSLVLVDHRPGAVELLSLSSFITEDRPRAYEESLEHVEFVEVTGGPPLEIFVDWRRDAEIVTEGDWAVFAVDGKKLVKGGYYAHGAYRVSVRDETDDAISDVVFYTKVREPTASCLGCFQSLPPRGKTRIYSWSGDGFETTVRYDPSHIRLYVLQDALRADSRAESKALFERAATRDRLVDDAWELWYDEKLPEKFMERIEQYLRGLAGLRLAVMALEDGDEEEARRWRNWLAKHASGLQLEKIVDELHGSTHQTPDELRRACLDRVEQHTAEQEIETWLREATAGLQNASIPDLREVCRTR